jgi:hypothetical protein
MTSVALPSSLADTRDIGATARRFLQRTLPNWIDEKSDLPSAALLMFSLDSPFVGLDQFLQTDICSHPGHKLLSRFVAQMTVYSRDIDGLVRPFEEAVVAIVSHRDCIESFLRGLPLIDGLTHRAIKLAKIL